MRFVPVNCIRDGMINGKTLVGKHGELLLSKGVVLTKYILNKIKDIGYNGIYIEDEISSDIEIAEVVSDKLRLDTVKAVKNTYLGVEKTNQINEQNIKDMKLMVENLVEELIYNRNLMVNMVDLKVFDDYTFYHCTNVAILSIIIGIALNLNKKDLYELGLGALLHDMGKVFIEKEILNKKGKLTDTEFEIMKTHSIEGYNYLKERYDIPPKSYITALQHHEKFDGTGYPMGLGEESISLFGRIVSVADVYDALTSDRPYRKAMLPSEAMEYIMGGGGTLFDTKIVMLFTRKVAPYPIGTCVMLSDERVGIVTENFEYYCMRPKLKIIRHNFNEVKPYYVDLRSKELINVTIKEIVN